MTYAATVGSMTTSLQATVTETCWLLQATTSPTIADDKPAQPSFLCAPDEPQHDAFARLIGYDRFCPAEFETEESEDELEEDFWNNVWDIFEGPGRKPKFVVDSPLGGRIPLDAVRNPAAPPSEMEADEGEQVWPYIPDKFMPVPVELIDTVKEVNYLAEMLEMHLNPKPMPTDDLDMFSDMLLSLETRSDITGRVLDDFNAGQGVQALANCGTWPDGDSHDIIPRAKKLSEHWRDAKNKAKAVGSPPDYQIAPLITLPIDGVNNEKDVGWKFEFTPEQAAQAHRLFMVDHTERIDAVAYWRDTGKRPEPLWWTPLDDSAFQVTPRDKIESGDLFHSKLWKPGYGSYPLIITLEKLEWVNPNKEERAEYEKYQQYSFERMKLSLDLKAEREGGEKLDFDF